MTHAARFLAGLFLAGALTAQSPTIDNLSPNGITAGSPGFVLTVSGSRFSQDSRVVWRYGGLGAAVLTTSFISETRLQAAVPATFIEQPATIDIAVTQGGLVSNVVRFGVFPGLAIATPCPLPNAIVNTPYELTLAPTGGTAPYTWSVAAGALPPGLTLAPTGAITGTATAAAVTSFVLRVTDAVQATATRACTLTVVAAEPGQTIFITALEPRAVLAGSGTTGLTIRGLGFRAGATAVWGFGLASPVDLPTAYVDPTRLTVTLPANLLAAPGVFRIAVRQVVLTSQQFSNAETFSVVVPPQVATPCPLRDAAVNQPYLETLVATGGFPPYSWSLVQGALPAGLTLSRNGDLAGTPVEAGQFEFALQTADSSGNTATRVCSLRVRGVFLADPPTISFAFDPAGLPPPPQEVSITAGAAGVPVLIGVSTQSGGSWLRASASSAVTPHLLRISADAGALPPGSYRGAVALTAEGTLNPAITIPVTLTVPPLPEGRIVAFPTGFRLAAPRGASDPMPRLLTLASNSTMTLSPRVTATAGWLRLRSTPSALAPRGRGAVVFEVDPAGLDPGVYQGAIAITAESAAQALRVEVPVVLAVSLSPELVSLTKTGITFRAVEGGPAPPPQAAAVRALGRSGFFWEARAQALGAIDWLSASPASDAARPPAVTPLLVSASPGALAAGLHYADLAVATPSADNSPRLAGAVVKVLARDAVLASDPAPAGLVFAPALGLRQSVQVRNLSRASQVIDFAVNPGDSVFTATAAGSRLVAPGESRTIEVAANTAGLAPGEYRAQLTVAAAGARAQAVELLLAVPRSPCAPARLWPVVEAPSPGADFDAGLPVGFDVRVVDDCGAPLDTGAVTLVPALEGYPTAALSPVGDGRWAGTWPAPASLALVPFALEVVAVDPLRQLSGSSLMPVRLIPNPATPVVEEAGVVSAAGFVPHAPLAPGGWAAIFGAQLADTLLAATGLPLPATLGGVQAQIGARVLPLLFASPGQANAQLPYETQPNTLQQLSVRRGGARSHFVDVPVALAQPRLFTVSQSGRGQAIVVDGANPTLIADARNPVSRGGVAVIYCEGLGPVNQPVRAGAAAPASPLAETVNRVRVTIGGRDAPVLYAGLTPGFAGLYQVNVTVPADAPVGDAVPVVVTEGAYSSHATEMAVR